MEGKEEERLQSTDLSAIIQLSVSSYGETEEEVIARTKRLLQLGAGKLLFGYEVSDLENPSNYILTCEDFVEKSPGFCGCCVGVAPTIDDLSFMLTAKESGSNLIHIHTADGPYNQSSSDFGPSSKTCVKIVINAETKGVVRLDFPPCHDGTHGDFTLEMIPVAVIGQDDKLVFIFRPCTEKSEDVTDIITGDGTGFVVAKVGPVESILNESRRGSTRMSKVKRDHFCVLFLDRLLGRSWKQLVFSVSTVFFYLWLIHKAYRTKPGRTQQEENSQTKVGSLASSICNHCTVS